MPTNPLDSSKNHLAEPVHPVPNTNNNNIHSTNALSVQINICNDWIKSRHYTHSSITVHHNTSKDFNNISQLPHINAQKEMKFEEQNQESQVSNNNNTRNHPRKHTIYLTTKHIQGQKNAISGIIYIRNIIEQTESDILQNS